MAAPIEKKVSKKIISSFDVFGGVLTWNFTNGESLSFDAGLSIEVSGTISAVQKAAMLHGFKQKISDAGAMACDQTTGLSPTPEARIAKMRRVAESLALGNWELERTGGTGGGNDSILVRALAENFTKPVDVIRTWLKAKTPAERTALRADKKIAKIITRMETEAAKSSNVDTGSLLGELADLG